MATDRSNEANKNNPTPGKKPGESMPGESSSMKERLLAQRRAAADAEAAAGAPPVPAARPAVSSAAARAQAAAAAARSTPQPQSPPKAEPASATSASSRRPVQLAGAREEERAAKREKKVASSEVMKEVEMLRKQQDKWIMYGWIVAGSMLLIAGVVYFVVKGKHDKIKADDEAKVAAVVNFQKSLQALDPKKPNDNDKILALLADPANDDFWKTDIQNAYTVASGLRAAAQRERERLKQQKDLVEGIAELEAICSNASSKSSDELVKARRRVIEYEIQGADLDDAFKARVKKAHACIDKGYILKLHDDAKAAAAKGPSEARNALTAVQKAEDEIVKMLDDATKSRMDQETILFYTAQLKEIIPEGDALVALIFTPDVIEKATWTDLLSGDQKDKWQHPAFKGWQIKDGVLQGVGPDLDSKATAIMSIGDAEQWRDFVLECEFALVKGEATFHFRLGPAVNNTTISLPFSTNGGQPFKAGQPTTINATALGSKFRLTFSDPDRPPYEDNELRWNVRRKGGIGISVPPGSEIRITKMRIKVLR